MRVLVAGCGDVGTALAIELTKAGDTVFGLRRHAARLPAPIVPVSADLADPATLENLPEVDAVVYTAAADQSTDDAYRRAYVDGVRHLLVSPALTRHRAERFLFVSSTAVYAQDDGGWVDETSPTEPTNFRGKRLIEGEKLVSDSGVTPVVLRLAGIYGPGRTRLIDKVRSGRATLSAGPPRYANRIHRDDCAGALAHLLRLENPAPLYLGVDDTPVAMNEVYAWLATALGAPGPSTESTPSMEAFSFEGTNKRCSNARLRASGYRFRYPTYREGYGALIAG